jgi:hypothetical protein
MTIPDEHDLFGGTILHLGELWKIKTPVTKELWDKINKIKPLESDV